MEANNTYTISTLNAQLAHARDMMIKAGCPGLRLTRSCDEDVTLARKIEDTCPFHAHNLCHVGDVFVLLWQ